MVVQPIPSGRTSLNLFWIYNNQEIFGNNLKSISLDYSRAKLACKKMAIKIENIKRKIFR
jgi:hypothetical protein